MLKWDCVNNNAWGYVNNNMPTLFTVFDKKHQNTVIMHDTGNIKMGFKLTIMYTLLSIQCVCVFYGKLTNA